MPDAWVAPAARVLTFLHRPDPDHLPDDIDALTGVPADGWTACGRPRLADELWVPVAYRPGDLLCPACEAAASGEAASGDVQEMLL